MKHLPCSWLAVLALSACAISPQPAARPACALSTQSAQVVDRLYLGRARPDGGEVSDDAFRAFLADIVTPRFPNGLTWWPAHGQWRSKDGSIVAERSVVLDLVHTGTPKERRLVEEIAADYKQRFQQEAVLQVSQPACVAF